MAVRLRLMRGGKKKQPTYRVVAAESSHRRDGRFIEIVGQYDPRQDPSLITIDNTKALRWLRNGAQPSDRVRRLLVISGAWAEFTGEAPPEPIAPAKGRGAAKVGDAAVPPPATATPALVIEDDGPADEVEPSAVEPEAVDAAADIAGEQQQVEQASDERADAALADEQPTQVAADEEPADAAPADPAAPEVQAEVEAADADGVTAAEENHA